MRALWLALPLVASGCAGMAFKGQRVPGGMSRSGIVSMVPGAAALPDTIYTSAAVPMGATENAVAKKKGEACATSILGWVTTGDASIRAAADAGGITAISAVDYDYTNILGVYAKLCTIVSGGEPVAAAPAAEPAPPEPAPAEPAPAEPAPPAPAEPKPEGARPPTP